MNRPITMSSRSLRATTVPGTSPKPAPPRPTVVVKPSPPGTDALALTELRNAAFTYDYLRAKNDPVQFWEMLRLARSRRAFDAEAGAASAPTPAMEASLGEELASIRRNYGPMVDNLRRYLKPIPGLPEPADRLEMALAFLLASVREHQAVAKWLAEPGKHEAKAAEKLRSLASITDPYREALRPWTLQVPEPAPAEEPDLPQAEFTMAEPEAAAPELDPTLIQGLQLAVQCREIFAGLYLDAELWETLVLTLVEPERMRMALDVLRQDAESELLEELQIDAEALFEKVGRVRSTYADWVGALRASLPEKRASHEDARTFDVVLGLAMAAPATRSRVDSWLDDPAGHGRESAELLEPWWSQAADYLRAAAPSDAA